MKEKQRIRKKESGYFIICSPATEEDAAVPNALQLWKCSLHLQSLGIQQWMAQPQSWSRTGSISRSPNGGAQIDCLIMNSTRSSLVMFGLDFLWISDFDHLAVEHKLSSAGADEPLETSPGVTVHLVPRLPVILEHSSVHWHLCSWAARTWPISDPLQWNPAAGEAAKGTL